MLLKQVDAVELEFLGLDGVEEPDKSSDAKEEDAFCQRVPSGWRVIVTIET